MPHKNPRCPKCGRKTEHHEWLWKHNRLSAIDPNTEVWERKVKCPNCGTETLDWKARWGHNSGDTK